MFEIGLNKEERTMMVKMLILEKLPEDNYTVLKYLTRFLAKVCFRCFAILSVINSCSFFFLTGNSISIVIIRARIYVHL